MRRLKFLVLTVGLLVNFTECRDFGRTGANFMNLPLSGELWSLGGAGCAAYLGADSLWLNPAGIYTEKKLDISSSYCRYLLDTAYHNISSSLRLKDMNLAFGYLYFYSNFDKLTLATGEIKDKNWGASGLLFKFGVSKNIIQDTKIGVALNLIRERLYNHSAYTTSLDAGLIKEYIKDKLYLGILLKNLWGSIKFKQESFPLARTLRLGSSFKFGEFAINLDFEKGINTPSILYLGITNCVFKDLFYINFGYNTSVNRINELSWGAHLKLKDKFILRYTFLPSSLFKEEAHIFSVDFHL